MPQVRSTNPRAVAGRFEELKQLLPGWLDGRGEVPAPCDLDWLAGAFDRSYPADLAPPYLFPTPEGGVLAEWDCKRWSPSLDIDPATRRGEWHLLNLDTDEERERGLDLTAPGDWAWLAAELRQLTGEAG